MNVGAFVCSCADTCAVDLEGVRSAVRDVEVVASSELLCDDGIEPMQQVIDEYDLDQLLITAVDRTCRKRFRTLAENEGLHPDAIAFIDHREGAGWVHPEPAATDKTARLINAAHAGLRNESVSRTVTRDTGDTVAVIGDAEAAVTLSEVAEVTLIADRKEFVDSDSNLDPIEIERGRVVDVDGAVGEFEVTLEARVTGDCISCMQCVQEGPPGLVTRYPIDISPDASPGEWTDVCPTDAIDLEGTRRTLTVDQVVGPNRAPQTPGGRLGYHVGPVDAATVAAVETLVDGIEKPAPLDLDLEVCAAGDSSKAGCNKCVDACPHDAVERPRIDAVEFDPIACQDCGACTSECPTGAVTLREPSNERIAREVEALLMSPEVDGGLLGSGEATGPGLESELIAFCCGERAVTALRTYGRHAAGDPDLVYPPILPVEVGCVDTIGEAHVLHALAAGADGVLLLGCGEACKHAGPDPKQVLTDRLNQATTDLGLGQRVAFLSPDPRDPAGFVERLHRFVDSLEASPVPAGDHQATGELADDRPQPPFNSHDWTLESVRVILEYVDPEREVIRGLADFGRMDVNDDCALTPTCSSMCPTDAIRRTDDGDLQFNHERCVNCGLCEEGCPEMAISMESGLDLSLLPERQDGDDSGWVTVFEGELLTCMRCGKPFTSKPSAEKVKDEVGDMVEGLAPEADGSVFDYCGDCRARLMFESGDA